MPNQLAFDAVGDGAPVVILHDLFGSGRNWNQIARALSASHRVYLPDARNHGASPWAESMSYTDMALDVLGLVQSEQLERPIIVGHGMGGKTAMALALEHAHAVDGVAVIDVAPEPYSDQFSPYMNAMRGLDLAAATSGREIRQTLIKQLSGDTPMDLLMDAIRQHDGRFDWRSNLLATAVCMQDLCGFPRWLLQQSYAGPALFIAGADSDCVRPESQSSIEQLFPNARLQRIADAGHWVHADQADALLQSLRGWLSETSALASRAL